MVANTRRVKKPMRTVTPAEFEPLRFVTKSPEEREPEERAVLFTLDDREFTIPKRFPIGLGLKVIRTMRRSGLEIATAELLEEVIGEDAYDALVNYPDLEPADMERLMEIVYALALGSVDAPKGRSASA